MDRLTEWRDGHGSLLKGDGYTKLARYEDTGREPEEVKNLEYTLMGVMHSVDKWLEGEELEQDEVNRAATMRKKILKLVEDLEAEVKRLRELTQEKEESRFLILPVNPGGTVWVLEPFYWVNNPVCKKCDEFFEGGMGDTPCCFRQDEGGNPCYTITQITASMREILWWLYMDSFGRTVFVTRGEAEEAMQRMEDTKPPCFNNDNGSKRCLGLAKGENDDEPIEWCKKCWYCESREDA